MEPISFRCCREPVVVGATHWYCLKKLIYRLFVDWKLMNLPTKLNRSLLAGLLGSMAVIGCGSDSEFNLDTEGRDLCVVSFDSRGDKAGFFELKDLGTGETFITPDNLDLEINVEGENLRLVDKRTSESLDVPSCEVETTESLPAEEDSSTTEPATTTTEPTTTSSTTAPTTTRPMTAPPSTNARTTTAAPMTAAPTTAAPTTAAPTTAAPTTTLPPLGMTYNWSSSVGCNAQNSLFLGVFITAATAAGSVTVTVNGQSVTAYGGSSFGVGDTFILFDQWPNLADGVYSVSITGTSPAYGTKNLTTSVEYDCVV